MSQGVTFPTPDHPEITTITELNELFDSFEVIGDYRLPVFNLYRMLMSMRLREGRTFSVKLLRLGRGSPKLVLLVLSMVLLRAALLLSPILLAKVYS